mgnify:CR=1 FL=1
MRLFLTYLWIQERTKLLHQDQLPSCCWCPSCCEARQYKESCDHHYVTVEASWLFFFFFFFLPSFLPYASSSSSTTTTTTTTATTTITSSLFKYVRIGRCVEFKGKESPLSKRVGREWVRYIYLVKSLIRKRSTRLTNVSMRIIATLGFTPRVSKATL